MDKKVLAHIAAIFTVLVWSITFVSTKVLLQYLSPFEILLCRTLLAFLALCLLRPRILRLQKPSHELLVAAAGFTGVLCYFMAENTALQFADASFVSIVVSTAPLLTALLSFVILKEKILGARFVVGFVLAISGIAIISLSGGPAHASALGMALCLGAAFSWAVYSVIVKRLSSFGYETIAITKRIFAWGLVYMAIIYVATGENIPLETLAQPIVWGNLAFLGLVASAACFVTWGFSVQQLGPTLTSAYIYPQTPVAVLWAVLLLGEPLTLAIVVGFVLVIVGLVLSEGFDKQIVAFARRPRA